jgi:serine phosphatase RsbU (regulator of sigma subunit)/anti-sigma regulatory factor (Ser/Thr protein kinase)
MSSSHANLSRTITLDVPCDFISVRKACAQARDFLMDCGVAIAEVGIWELLIAEAANNASKYATDTGRQIPFRLNIIVTARIIEVRVTDHTAGFDFPDRAELPAADSESGRGVFLMQSLSDEAYYLRGDGTNCLVLRRNRAMPVSQAEPPIPAPEPAETERTLDLMTEELASAYESLSAVFRFSAGLQNAAGWEDFSRKWLEELCRIVGADWYILRLMDAQANCLKLAASSRSELAFGPLDMTPLPVEQCPNELTAATTRNDAWFDAQNPLRHFDPLHLFSSDSTGFSHPLQVNEQLIGVLTVGRDGNRLPFEAAQVNVIQTIADFLAIHIRNSQFYEEQLQSRLVAKELAIAAQIQRSLLPTKLPTLSGFSIVGHSASASQVGGDFYDALPTPDGGVLLAIADVMGKGVPAAMFAAIFRSHLHTGIERTFDPGELLTWINRVMSADLDRVEMFITARLVHVNTQSRVVRVAAAGHPPLLVVGGDGVVQQSADASLPIGLMADTEYGVHNLPLPVGARLLLFTDGLTESRDAAGELMGLPPLVDCLVRSATAGESGEQLKSSLISLLRSHENGIAPVDDETFILLTQNTPPLA